MKPDFTETLQRIMDEGNGLLCVVVNRVVDLPKIAMGAMMGETEACRALVCLQHLSESIVDPKAGRVRDCFFCDAPLAARGVLGAAVCLRAAVDEAHAAILVGLYRACAAMEADAMRVKLMTVFSESMGGEMRLLPSLSEPGHA